MSKTTEGKQQTAHQEIMERLPGLMYERSRLRSAGIEPTSVLLPGRLNISYDGDDATAAEATCMGLPVTWSATEQWGVVVALPEPKKSA